MERRFIVWGAKLIQINREEIFDRSILDIMPQLANYSNYDLIIGIPFIDEEEHLVELLCSVDRVLKTWMGKRQLIICVGDHSAGKTLEMLNSMNLQHPHLQFLLPEEIGGRGTSVRAIIEISKRLDADLLLFSAKMANEIGPGIEDSWLDSLFTPIQGPYDLVLGSLRRHIGIDSIAHMLAAPVLEAFYGFRLGDPLGGIYAISHDFAEELAHEARFGEKRYRGGHRLLAAYPGNPVNKNICEVNMGGRVIPHSLEVRNRVFADNSMIIFEALKKDVAVWLQERPVIKVADILARSEIKRPDLISYSVKQLRDKYTGGIKEYAPLLKVFNGIVELEKLTMVPEDDFNMEDEIWVNAFFYLLLQYTFQSEKAGSKEYLHVLTALYNGRIASYVLEMQRFNASITCDTQEEEMLSGRKMESVKQRLTSCFWQLKPDFIRQWITESEKIRPAILPLGYMEYVPGKPIVIPKKIVGKDGRLVNTDNIFKAREKDMRPNSTNLSVKV
jgi:hypothetical protein